MNCILRKWRLFEVMQQDDARQVFTVISFPRRRSADTWDLPHAIQRKS